ncbi:polysaccharide biosynthesis/export family protein [Aquisphaera insulae]|uniref:polysaccharide biosynthesis/export family protein n=1 Tax=Aquisphaera insulae TaxID=2712864 RepID=UPI00202EEDB6|nr:polysaccharide biosynthesis/export family protein [Aquisphaera insulae]
MPQALLRRSLTGLVGMAFTLGLATGCADHARRREVDRIPTRGMVDPAQPRELDKTTMPRYVIEPPDELDVTIRPAPTDWVQNTIVVQQDGMIDLGFAGEIYVTGLTVGEAEYRIAQEVNAAAVKQGQKPEQPYKVSVRVTNPQSKFYYVMGTVNSQGRFPIKGNETVLDAILLAGLKSNSLPEKSYLVRPHPPGEPDTVLRIDWCAIRERGDTMTNYQLLPGDRIVVPGTKPPSLISTLLAQ